MGCTVSKLDNEETVRRCKERRRLMKDAVYARHHLAAAHSDYCRSLRLTGSALFAFAAGEPLAVSHDTPAVVLNSSTASATAKNPQPPCPPPSATVNNPQPPSPPPSATANNLQPRPPPPAATVTNFKLPPIVTSSAATRRRKPPPKLPHILSESSLSSTPRSETWNFFPTAHQTESSPTSQASSVWNWENFRPPPTPPGSDYFRQRSQNRKPETNLETSESESELTYNFFHSKPQQHNFKIEKINADSQQLPQRHRLEREGSESEYDYFRELEPVHSEREEVLCSEWEDRYSSTSSSEQEEGIAGIESPAMAESVAAGDAPAVKDEKFGDDVRETNKTVRHRDLKEIVEAVRDNFEKAAVAGDHLSEILEISKAQLDRSFKQLRKTLHHSSSILSNLSSSWTSKPPLVVKYQMDAGSLEGPGGPKSLGFTLERLLAWENKLYQEVKAREGVKIEHEKKLAALQSQEYKNDETKLDKTKASITRLQSLIVVTSQAVSTTSAAINGLRDSDLVPQLGELCHGILYMWRSMHQYHQIQSNIVQQVRGLVNQSSKGHSTSELHKKATRDLESAVSAWHSSFCRLIKFQRDFILSLHGWFKLNLIPVNNDSTIINNKYSSEPSNMFSFCDEWKLALDRIPDTVASEAIKSFINVVHVISVKQSEEHKLKKRSETASKELEKKSSSLRKIEKKFYNSYSMVGITPPDSVPNNGQALDARDPLAEKKLELAACQRRVEDEIVRHSKAVEVTRAMTLNNLQTGLPGVFQALTNFSYLFTEALEAVCARSYAIK